MNVAKTVSLVKNPQLEGNGLKVGDFVFVRILKKLENNKAIISFGGQSFEAAIDDKNQLLSKYPSGLVNGGFRAKILQENDKILLQIFERLETQESQNITQNSIQNLINQNDIKNYLQNSDIFNLESYTQSRVFTWKSKFFNIFKTYEGSETLPLIESLGVKNLLKDSCNQNN